MPAILERGPPTHEPPVSAIGVASQHEPLPVAGTEAWPPGLGQPRLLALSTAVPPYVMHQSDVLAQADRIFDRRTSEIERILGVFGNAGIDTRYGCIPLDWHARPHDWAERNHLYLENAVALLERAAAGALAGAGLLPRQVDGIVTVSSTGIATPSLDALLMERLAFGRNVWRLPVFGLGCAGGVLGLARAAQMAKGAPKQKILVLVVELCTLTFRNTDQSKSNIIATALFGDGAAAAVIGCDGDGPEIAAWGEYCWPASLDVMGWRIENDGFGVLFSRDIPSLVRTRLRAAAASFLENCHLTFEDITGYICHPGGAKVIRALEDAFFLPEGALAEARTVLRDYGNMSAATIMFVLERMRRADPKGLHLMSALGPGFTAAFLTLAL